MPTTETCTRAPGRGLGAVPLALPRCLVRAKDVCGKSALRHLASTPTRCDARHAVRTRTRGAYARIRRGARLWFAVGLVAGCPAPPPAVDPDADRGASPPVESPVESSAADPRGTHASHAAPTARAHEEAPGHPDKTLRPHEAGGRQQAVRPRRERMQGRARLSRGRRGLRGLRVRRHAPSRPAALSKARALWRY